MNKPVLRFAVIDAPGTQAGLAGFTHGVWRRMRPSLLLLALGISFATYALVRALHIVDAGNYKVPPDQWKSNLLIQSLFIASLMLAVLVADEAVSRGTWRWPTYLAALFAGSAFAAWAQWELISLFRWENVWTKLEPGIRDTQPLQFFFTGLLFGTFGCFIYVNQRTARLAADRMRAAELARAQARRRTLESRLQAMQARVEPQFLFNTLAQVRELYERDPATAGHMLDDLISYLRAALPHLRESSSTLGRELDLARAYLDIMRVRLGDRLVFEIEMPEEAKGARMPPMMLLPLIDHALVYGLQPGDERGSIRIETSAESGRLRLRVTDSGVAFVPGGQDGALASIDERLHALYGDDARFELERMRERGTRATLEIPYEVTDLRDR